MALTKAKLEELVAAGGIPSIATQEAVDALAGMLGGSTLVKCGTTTIATAGSTPNVGSATVAFGATFAAAPIVLAVSNTGRPDQRFASAGAATTTGVPITVVYTGSTAAVSISVSWIAIGVEA